jgi:hypothetical protein
MLLQRRDVWLAASSDRQMQVMPGRRVMLIMYVMVQG